MSSTLRHDIETEALLEAMRDHYDSKCKDCEGARQGCLTAKVITAYNACLKFGLFLEKEG